MDLSGTWRAAVADDDLRRSAVAPGLRRRRLGADRGARPLAVSTPAFADTDGPLIYRTRFDLEPGPPGARHWVVLDGIFYQADVWLDGAYLGDPEGYFFPHAYEITDLARLGAEHVLAVEVTCTPQADRTAKRNLTGVFQHWDCIDPTGTRAGCGGRCASSGRARCASTGCACCAARPTPTRASLQRARPSWTATSPRRCGSAPRVDERRRARARTLARPRARTRSSGRSASTTPRCGGRAPWATSR